MKWIKRKIKMVYWKWMLRKMLRAMRKEGWDADDMCAVLLHIGGEIEVLPPSVKERLGMPTI